MHHRSTGFRNFVEDLAREIPSKTGLPCHLRRVRVTLRMSGSVAAYAEPSLSRVTFSRATRRFVEEVLVEGSQDSEKLAQDRAREQADILAHELLHLRFDARQAEKNIDAEILLPGLLDFDEALTTLLSRQVVPHVLARLGIHAGEEVATKPIPQDRVNDYEYVIVPLLKHAIGQSAKKKGVSEKELLDTLGAADTVLKAAYILFQPFFAGDWMMQVHSLRGFLGIFDCASHELEAYVRNVKAGREQVLSLNDVESRCQDITSTYIGLMDKLLHGSMKQVHSSHEEPIPQKGIETIH